MSSEPKRCARENVFALALLGGVWVLGNIFSLVLLEKFCELFGILNFSLFFTIFGCKSARKFKLWKNFKTTYIRGVVDVQRFQNIVASDHLQTIFWLIFLELCSSVLDPSKMSSNFHQKSSNCKLFLQKLFSNGIQHRKPHSVQFHQRSVPHWLSNPTILQRRSAGKSTSLSRLPTACVRRKTR